MSVTELKSPPAPSPQSSQKPVTSTVAEAVQQSGLAPARPEVSLREPALKASEMKTPAKPSSAPEKNDPTPLYSEPESKQQSSSQPSAPSKENASFGSKVDADLKPKITVVGVGGAGCNAVNNMISSSLQGVQFVVCNTDAQALSHSLTDRRIQLGHQITQGLGAGSKPEVGHAAAEESLQDIIKEISGSNMVFITAGMGGGTGTGAAPVVAQAARELGILTVAVATKPFHFEGNHRMKTADHGIEELAQYVDTLIVIPNQNLFRIATEKTGFMEAFKLADNVLHSGVRGVTDLMMMPGLINLDFADIRSVMSEMGKAMMGTGEASGEGRSIAAAEAAISNPLLDDVSMKGARGVLINITGGMDMTLFEVDEAANRIRDEVDPDANIIFGSTFDEKLEGVMRVSVVATGIEAEESRRRFVRYQEEKAAQESSSDTFSSQTPEFSFEADQEDETIVADPSSGEHNLDQDIALSEDQVTHDGSAQRIFEDHQHTEHHDLIEKAKPKKKGFFSRFAGTLRRGSSSEDESYKGVSDEHSSPRNFHEEGKTSVHKSHDVLQKPSVVSLEDENVQDIPAYLRRQNRR